MFRKIPETVDVNSVFGKLENDRQNDNGPKTDQYSVDALPKSSRRQTNTDISIFILARGKFILPYKEGQMHQCQTKSYLRPYSFKQTAMVSFRAVRLFCKGILSTQAYSLILRCWINRKHAFTIFYANESITCDLLQLNWFVKVINFFKQ